MAITVLNPARGTSNAQWYREVIATITSDQNDTGGLYDLILIDSPALTSVVFTLPKAGSFPGKVYDIMWRTNTSGNGGATVSPASGDTVGGGATFGFASAGQVISVVSDGGTNWIVKSQ